jgi:hypothetical protein
MWWCGIGSEDQNEYEGTNAAEFWPSEHRRWRVQAAVLDGDRCYDESGHESKQGEAQEFG